MGRRNGTGGSSIPYRACRSGIVIGIRSIRGSRFSGTIRKLACTRWTHITEFGFTLRQFFDNGAGILLIHVADNFFIWLCRVAVFVFLQKNAWTGHGEFKSFAAHCFDQNAELSSLRLPGSNASRPEILLRGSQRWFRLRPSNVRGSWWRSAFCLRFLHRRVVNRDGDGHGWRVDRLRFNWFCYGRVAIVSATDVLDMPATTMISPATVASSTGDTRSMPR